MKCRNVLTMLVIAGISGLSVLAAPPKTESKTAKPQVGNPASRSADQRTSWKNADHMLATCIAIDNQEEVAISEFAEKKVSNADVKQFAKMLIEDHTSFLAKLEKFAPEATRDGFLTEDRTAERPQSSSDDKKSPTPTAIQRTAAKPNLNDQEAMPIDFLALGRELAQQCLHNTEEMLNAKKDHERDACFVGMQIARHAGMKTKLEVYQRHASGELKDLLAAGLKTTTSHMKHAEKLMEQLAESSSKTADAK